MVAQHAREARDELDQRVEEERSTFGTRVAQEWHESGTRVAREKRCAHRDTRQGPQSACARERVRERATTIEVIVDEAPNCAHEAIMSAVGERTGEGGDGEADDGEDVNGEAEGGGGLAEATN